MRYRAAAVAQSWSPESAEGGIPIHMHDVTEYRHIAPAREVVPPVSACQISSSTFAASSRNRRVSFLTFLAS